MSKMMLRALATTSILAAFALSSTAGPAAAMVGSAGLAQALDNGDLVQLVQQKKKRKGGKSSQKLSKGHQDKIRQHVPAEYHQYIPGMGGGAGGGAGGAGGAGGGIPGR